MSEQTAAVSAKELRVEHPNDWCPGCGDFGILSALQQALAKLGKQRHEVAVVGGIGCSGKAQYYMNTYGISTLHGRPLPYATGIKLANPELTVVIVGGDGDGLGIGAGHFVNAGRRNVDLTYILFNNEVYGLTKGQAAPTLPLGLQTKSLPEANIQGSINPLMLALASGFTWIGRGYSFNIPQLTELIRQAIEHEGLSYLDVLQPCPTYNDIHTKEWFGGKDRDNGSPRVVPLDDSYDPHLPKEADEDTVSRKIAEFVQKANEWGDRIPTGVFFVNNTLPSYAGRIARRIESYKNHPPAKRVLADKKGTPVADLKALLKEFAIPAIGNE